MERDGRIEKITPNTLINFYKNIVLFENLFLGRKIRQKSIFYAKNTLKNTKNQTFFAKNIFGETVIAFLAEFLANCRRSFYEIKKF